MMDISSGGKSRPLETRGKICSAGEKNLYNHPSISISAESTLHKLGAGVLHQMRPLWGNLNLDTN